MSEIPRDDRRPGLAPPKFRLSTLMLVMTLLCMLFALLGNLNPLAGFGVILLVLAVLAHLAGAALGAQLKANGDQPQTSSGQPVQEAPVRRKPLASDFAPPTKLSQPSHLGMVVVVSTCGGATLGALSGGTWLISQYWQSTPALGVALALLGSGAIGGLAGFLMSCLLKTSLLALWQAKQDTFTPPRGPLPDCAPARPRPGR